MGRCARAARNWAERWWRGYSREWVDPRTRMIYNPGFEIAVTRPRIRTPNGSVCPAEWQLTDTSPYLRATCSAATPPRSGRESTCLNPASRRISQTSSEV